MNDQKNPYLPMPVRIARVTEDTEDRSIRSFLLEFLNEEDARGFDYLPGQFAELSIAGSGEIPIGIASSPTEGRQLLFTVSRAGVVTTRLHGMAEGEVMGVRGPLGRPFPLAELEGRNIVIIAGGFAVTTLRSAMVWLLHPEHRSRYGRITFIYGARTPGMLLYRSDWEEWRKRADVDCLITVDREAQGWEGEGRLRAPDRRAGRAGPREQRRTGLRPPGDDPLHPACPRPARLAAGADLPEPGEPHEVRRGRLRPVQRRPLLRLQGRPGPVQSRTRLPAPGILKRFPRMTPAAGSGSRSTPVPHHPLSPASPTPHSFLLPELDVPLPKPCKDTGCSPSLCDRPSLDAHRMERVIHEENSADGPCRGLDDDPDAVGGNGLG
jgi:NAD(P)H-flavin reductase